MSTWQTTEQCAACDARGDVIDDPLYMGECHICGGDCCCKCGLVEGDVDGNTNTCGECMRVGANDDEVAS